MEWFRHIFGVMKKKPFKVQDAERKHCKLNGPVGLTASSLQELKKKAASKLNISGKCRIVLEEDGTEIEDEEYFSTLEPQTVLVVLRPEQHWDGYISYLKLATEKIVKNISGGMETIEHVRKVLYDPEAPELSFILEYLNTIQGNVEAENRDEDPEWFEGVIGNHKTKQAVMRHGAKGRIRGYYYNCKDLIDGSSLDKQSRKKLLAILDNFRAELKTVHHFEDIFDRSSDADCRICDEEGWFHCEGPYNENSCRKYHTINPYATRDCRVFFKTWNLDHRIEKSREVIPKLIQAVKNCPRGKAVNWKYFFKLLFTRANLKLVDVRCHVLLTHIGEKQIDILKSIQL